MTLDNSLINDTFMYPYAMEYNAPLTPVYNFTNYSCNSNMSHNMNGHDRMVSEKFLDFIPESDVEMISSERKPRRDIKSSESSSRLININ
jgi:hypothetical protein